jgi:hypothetical protein
MHRILNVPDAHGNVRIREHQKPKKRKHTNTRKRAFIGASRSKGGVCHGAQTPNGRHTPLLSLIDALPDGPVPQ